MKNLLSFVFVVLIILTQPKSANADYTPFNFASCDSPSGSLTANYHQGEHAIVGTQNLQSGSDQVYDQGQDNYTQCFCPTTSTTGIQTNWLAAGQLSKEEINVLITQGWTYFDDGAGWGLSDQPYLANNLNFSCNKGGGGSTNNNGSNGSSGTSSTNTSSTSSAGGQGGSVLGISSLAATSSPNTPYQIWILTILALGLIVYGYKLQKNKK